MKKYSETQTIVRADIEDFLFQEARLLDMWSFEQWLEMLAADAVYLVPSLDCPDNTPDNSLHLIADDRKRIESRVKQLQSPLAWAENPHSRTRRMISNVLIIDRTNEAIDVEASFAVWRFKNNHTDLYVGRYVHRFVLSEGRLLLQTRRAVLDLETLRPHGKLSFIL